MSDFYDISAGFDRLNNSLKSRISSALYEESTSLLSAFRDRSPVDTGLFKSSWQLRKSRHSAGNVIAGYVIYNRTPYAYYMEKGANIGQEPWFFGVKASRAGSRKLRIVNGRVWAGGLNPGHSKTVGGAIGPALIDNKRRIDQLTNKIADAVIGGFTW